MLAAALALAAGASALLLFGSDLWQPDAILAHRDALRELAAASPVLTLALFTGLYFAIVSSALPVGPPMSLIAGFLFGRWIGTAAILIAATAGAVVVFSVARASADTALGRRLRARAGPIYERVARDVRENAFAYLVVMRLVPVFPFFLVNVVAGLIGPPLRVFAAATLVGRLPATFVYVSLGQEVGRVSSLDELLSPRIVLTLSAVGLLALVPVVLRHRRGRQSSR